VQSPKKVLKRGEKKKNIETRKNQSRESEKVVEASHRREKKKGERCPAEKAARFRERMLFGGKRG